MVAIDGFDGQATTRLALHLMAILAQRPGELRHARWDEFDLDEAVWLIPAEKMKMRKPHNVPLPAQALALLEELRLIVTVRPKYACPNKQGSVVQALAPVHLIEGGLPDA